MPILFIHGVNTRQSPEYDAKVLFIAASLGVCFQGLRIGNKAFGARPHVAAPYWGDLASKFKWEMASLPSPDVEQLGIAFDPDLADLIAYLQEALGGTPTDAPLLLLARRDLDAAVELIAATVLAKSSHPPEKRAELAMGLQAVAAQEPPPVLPDDLETDEDFFLWLGEKTTSSEVEQLGAFPNLGLGRFFRRAREALVDPVLDGVGDFASTQLLRRTREPLNAILGRFFGDVFIYLDRRVGPESPGAIPRRLLAAIDDARAQAPTEPLVIVGHSLGGVIAFDLLQSFRKDIEVDLFVSVGSQVAHFEEMKLYRGSDERVGPPSRAVVPANVARWINVYDEVDIFSYTAHRVFDRVFRDLRYDTRTYVIKAHGAYFDQSRFYRWLRAQLVQAQP